MMEPMEELREETVETPKTPEKKRRLPLTHALWAKITAFALVIVSLAVMVGGGLYILVAKEQDIYVRSEESLRQEVITNLTEGYAINIAEHILEDKEGSLMAELQKTNIAGYGVERLEEDGTEVALGGGGSKTEDAYRSEWFYVETANGENFFAHRYQSGDVDYSGSYVDVVNETPIAVTVYLKGILYEKDEIYLADKLISLAYGLRYWILLILVAAFVSLVLGFVFLMCAAGHRKGKSEVQSGWGTKVPFDLLTVASAFGVYACVALGIESTYYWEPFLFVIIPLVYVVGVSIVLGWCMSLALRLKLGRFWKDTVICWGLGFIWRGIRTVFRGVGSLLAAIPLAPLCVLIFGAVFLVELFVMLGINYVGDLAAWWALEKLVLFGAMLYLVLVLKKLERGGAAIAAGDLSYQVDTRAMPAHFRRHGENLNRIGEGMTAAVEERMRSERMKTELITNVSHDIKTPLTSIINYADLIAKEKCENETITEYAAVLHRQSERLKRLIEDLVEASKASSGSIEVNLQPCEAGVFLTQAAGEYALRLQESSLQLVTDQPSQPIYIMADGRRLWRVLDNLMNNVCKYAQSGTRVYLTLHAEGQQAVITLKNISRDALNIPPHELMERFVRADASRRSEGSGLGLSIARSLTELQGGSMELSVDGDLFKVTLRFPIMP